MNAAERARLIEEEFLAIRRGRREEDIGRIVRSKTMHGRPWVLAGTRIPLSAIYSFIDAGDPPEEVLQAYPDLSLADVEAALAHRTQPQAA